MSLYRRNIIFVLSFCFYCLSNLLAQPKTGILSGIVLDQKSLKPIEFATVIVHKESDGKQLTGISTNALGQFALEGIPAGTYFIRISYIGFEFYQSKNLEVAEGSNINLGKISLLPKDIGMKDVIVQADRVAISYQIDKKVINVGENITALSGTAVDVLENIPSVTVDIDGNVSLRGSGNFTVLFDGHPTVMDGNTALQQTPASSIENIEIITNPSAKYDPEGTAGIINIILKKNSTNGISGIAGLNAGLKDKYGAELLTNYKNQSTQINLGLNYNKRNMTSNDISRNWTNDGKMYSYYNSDGSSYRQGEFLGLRGSVAWDFGNDKILSIGGRYGDRNSKDNATSNYNEWTSIDNIKNYYNSKSSEEGGEKDYHIMADYSHPFNKEGHELTLELDYESEDGSNYSINSLTNNSIIVDSKKTYEAEPTSEFTSKIDYKLPLSEKSKFEAGYQGELQSYNEKSNLEIYDTDLKIYQRNALYSNDIQYYNRQLAIYSLYSNEIGNFGYKLGVRGEYTGREVDIAQKNLNYTVDEWEYFPTAHFSLNLGDGNQLMTSYTKRINRPHGWEFEPCIIWIDAFNVRTGNPSILPQYIDSYELGFQKTIGNSLVSIDSYYRVTKNKIERVRSYYAENVTLQTSQNVGKDYALGAELFFNFDPINKWNVNLMGNLYNYRIKGNINGLDFNRNSFNWNVRFNNTIKLSPETMIQLNAIYNSPTVSSQGRREGYMSTNLAVKQVLFNKLLTATLQIRDLFSAAKNEDVNESFDFYNYRYSERESPVVMLNLRFNINNYKNDREAGEENTESEN